MEMFNGMFTTSQFVLWCVLLFFQNAAFTWVSRARNSGSDWYHAFAAIFSNGLWFIANFFTFKGLMIVWAARDYERGAWLGVTYVICTAYGSVFAGRFLRNVVEKGKRRVGHYEN